VNRVDRRDVERFRDIVARRLGLQFDDSKLEFLTEIVAGRLEERRAEVRPYLDLLDRPDGRDEWRALADPLTVAETYFFRYADHFRAFSDIVLPDRMRERGLVRQLRILSAGCASGEEPYSLAILVRDRLGVDLGAWDVRITAVDVSPAAIRKSRRGVYSAWSLRETPVDVRQRDFRADGREFTIARTIADMVAFEERNLVEADADFWCDEVFDVVFCRNVIMYFAPEVARALVARVSASLVPGGYLFLGHAETLRGISNDFHLRHTHDTFYYQRRRERVDAPVGEPESAGPPPAGLLEPDGAWVDAIRRASERIESLATGVSAPAPAAPPPGRLEPAMELMRQERFSDALDHLRALPPESTGDPEARLLSAVILTNAGRLKEAEEICGGLLGVDDLNAGAHYLMALCREHDGDLSGAMSHDQIAVYLDATFAMPRFHGGLVARRLGDTAAARRDLAHAADLLAREDPSRVLLFGGGFSREALVELCRSELRACGGPP